MNEEEVKKALSGLDEESLAALEKVLDNPDADGMAILATLLAIPDEQFEVLRPVFQDTMVNSYSDPQIQMQLVNLFAQAGISIEEIINNSDAIIDNIFSDNNVELSEPKKDFIRTIFNAAVNSVSSSTINPAHVVNIPIEICRENAKLPTYSTQGSAAMDIYSPEEYIIDCGQTIVIPIGIKVSIPHGYALLIQPRSGLSSRTKLRIANTPGLIDEDYHEEIGVIVENTDPPLKDYQIQMDGEGLLQGPLYGSPITIDKGERFAQMRLIEVPHVKWSVVSSLGAFDDDHGAGFGSTGVK